MENENNKLLKQILANQAIIYKRLEEIEYKIKGGMRSASIKSYVEELNKKAGEALKYIE